MQDEYYQLHKKTVQHPQNCFGTPIWWMWRSMSSFGGTIDEVVQMEKPAHIKVPRRKATLTGLPG